MGYPPKIPPDEKIRIAEEYLAGRLSPSEFSRSSKISRKLVYEWVRLYQLYGAAAFGEKSLPQTEYSSALKLTAVEDYQRGGKTKREICEKYRIHSISSLFQWIEYYNGHSGDTPQRTENDAMTDEYVPKRKKPRLGKQKPEDEMTESERFLAELKRKELENYKLQMENDILKKLAEVERRRDKPTESGWKTNT